MMTITKLLGRSLTLAILASLIALHLEGPYTMARGAPDGELVPYGFATHETDPGTIYQYLWGWSPIDSKGRPFYLDTFNNGLSTGWRLSNSGAGIVPTLITDGGVIYSPPNAVQLNPGTIANDRSFFYREMFMGKTTRLGFEAGVRMSDTMPETRFQFDYKAVGNPGGLPILRWLPSAGAWQIWTNTGWVTIYTPGIIPANTSFFVQIKFVADFSNYNNTGTGRWIRLLIGDQVFDLTATTRLLDISGATYTGMLIATVLGVSTGGSSTVSQVGYILLTKDEP